MEAGQSNKKVCFIIQARMNSKRLAGKVLFPFPLHNGKPLLLWITDALKKSTLYADIIVATSTEDIDDLIESFCGSNGIKCFRGSEDNVLSRFVKISKSEQYQSIVRLTGDNPIVDVEILDNLIKKHVDSNNDYTYSEGLPLGMNFEIISSKVFKNLDMFSLNKNDFEHVTPFLKKNNYIRQKVKFTNEFQKVRLTIDYPSDAVLLSTILGFSAELDIYGLDLIKWIYEKYPWIFELNHKNIQL